MLNSNEANGGSGGNLFSAAIREDGEYKQLADAVKQQRRGKPKPVMVTGLCEGASDALCAALAEDMPGGRPLLLLCAEEKDCRRLSDELNAFGLRAGFYPVRDLNFYNITASREFEQARLAVLLSVQRGETDVVITTPDAALGYTMPPDILRETVTELHSGDRIEPEELIKRLICGGYSRADLAEGPGQFARRGGIVDICYNETGGGGVGSVRIEFFDDEVDRLCRYDTVTQRVTENIQSVILPPAREIVATAEQLKQIAGEIGKLRERSRDARVNDELDNELTAVNAAVAGGGEVRFLDKYISLIYPQKACLLDYFSSMSLCVVRGNAAVGERLKGAEWRAQQEAENLTVAGTLAGRYAEFSAPSERLGRFYDTHTTVIMDSLMQGVSGMSLGGLFGFRSKHSLSCGENETLLKEELEGYVSGKYKVILMTSGETQAKNYAGLLTDWGFTACAAEKTGAEILGKMHQGEIAVIPAAPLQPFELPTPRIAVISLLADGGRGTARGKTSRNGKRHKDTNSTRILSYAELREGDYVVHENHGIGQYMGITTMNVGGANHDYITIQYAGSDKLFLPVEKLDRVSKYIGAHSDDGTLKLSKFGGTEWGRAKARAKASLKNIAKELIALYAERMRRPGFAYSKDDDFQRDFEAAFEYDETDAQLDAIDEIKEDMEKATPMDRLLCGDVGYGKTEVAFRAIYKAILSGKQVALLVPTTILALQHYQTAQSRMRSFPVNIEMLSRFRTPKEQKKIIGDIEKGDVDLIIGTHRLLSSDIKFRDLGLLVVDEEQRFGVAQKEKIKQRAGNIDVLSLSATPIPRTLNMAMTGIRDISLLDEAPGDRSPVQTYVLEHDEIIIMDAIRRELRRGGQVFYLYNFVESIGHVAEKIKRAVPDARVVMAHGKMEKDQLEDIWRDMIAGDIDVLVSTTIIETGVDVPNANTLIVENSDRMGLSQLHQLRGRVGRSPRRAYAYFTFPRNKALTEIAEKRLEAVREYAEFGAGFQIALRDLEIRGAGSVLGAEQHGHLDEIGYDLYVKLLNEAVLEEKGETLKKETDCAVSLNVDAYLPDSYVPSASQRMSLYKKIAHIRDQKDLDDLYDELCDRYGEPPLSALYLLDISLLRALAVSCGITSVTQNGNEYRIKPEEFDPVVWNELSSSVPGKMRLVLADEPYLTLNLRKNDDAIGIICEIFKKYLKISCRNK